MKTLKNKLALSHSLIAIVIIVVIGWSVNLSIDSFFETFAINKRNQQISRIMDQINEQYGPRSCSYNIEGLALIGNAALQNGIIMHLRTINNEIDWDVRLHKEQECLLLLQHAEMNMHSRYPNFKGGYVEETHELKNGNVVIGTVTFGFYGPYSLNDEELAIMSGLNRVILVMSTVFIALSILLGIIMARHIAKPIAGVIDTAQQIARGSYGAQTNVVTSTTETANLVTAINEMSMTLEKEEQQKRQISSDVAHELRTPLSNLQSHMEAMIDEVWEPTKERLTSCHTEIVRLNNIVEQLQELYLLENNKTELCLEHIDFSCIATSVLQDFELIAKEKSIHIVKQVPEGSLVYADSFRLTQGVINLLSNAVKYTPIGGKIVIRYQEKDNSSLISVRDTGPGIPQEDLPHIFERFYRVDKSRTKTTGGMGIGLAITKAIVESHNGELRVSSEVNKGTKFTIYLPKPKVESTISQSS